QQLAVGSQDQDALIGEGQLDVGAGPGPEGVLQLQRRALGERTLGPTLGGAEGGPFHHGRRAHRPERRTAEEGEEERGAHHLPSLTSSALLDTPVTETFRFPRDLPLSCSASRSAVPR